MVLPLIFKISLTILFFNIFLGELLAAHIWTFDRASSVDSIRDEGVSNSLATLHGNVCKTYLT